jgi:hypothetical protein
VAASTAVDAAPLERRAGHTYERSRPERTALHQLVRDNLRTLFAAVEDGFAHVALPSFVTKELTAFVDCGVLARGLAIFQCKGSCKDRVVVALSCKGRGFCPRCLGRRMAQTTANWIDHVLPPTPLRQFVLTLPHPLRARLGYDGPLLGAVCRTFVDSILAFYRRRMASLDPRARQGQGGAVTVVQRTSSDMTLNPHLHVLALYGLFVPGAQPDAPPVFVPLPRLSTTDVADLLQVVRVRVCRLLLRLGVIEPDADLAVLPGDLADRQPALAQLAYAAVSGLPPAGPQRRRRPVHIPLPGRPGVIIDSPLSVSELGFSLHAATRVGTHDARARGALCKYLLRPPLAKDRVALLPEGLVRLTLKRPFRDGTWAVEMDPLAFLCRLAAAIPPPRQHQIRYAGVLAPHAKWRALVVPRPPAETSGTTCDQTSSTSPKPRPPTHRCRYRSWQELLRKAFSIDLESCPRCAGKLRFLALLTEPAALERLLRHLGESTTPPTLEPARAPPYISASVARIKQPPEHWDAA